eukprot:COSAG02_NODE_2171_length_9598_cov_30.756817_8_plen_227_part_00
MTLQTPVWFPDLRTTGPYYRIVQCTHVRAGTRRVIRTFDLRRSEKFLDHLPPGTHRLVRRSDYSSTSSSITLLINIYYYYTLVPYLVFFLLYLSTTYGTKYIPTLDKSISQSFPHPPRLGRILPSHAAAGKNPSQRTRDGGAAHQWRQGPAAPVHAMILREHRRRKEMNPVRLHNSLSAHRPDNRLVALTDSNSKSRNESGGEQTAIPDLKSGKFQSNNASRGARV